MQLDRRGDYVTKYRATSGTVTWCQRQESTSGDEWIRGGVAKNDGVDTAYLCEKSAPVDRNKYDGTEEK